MFEDLCQVAAPGVCHGCRANAPAPCSVRVIRYGHVYADITWRQYVHTTNTTKHTTSSEIHNHSLTHSSREPWLMVVSLFCVRQIIYQLLEIKNHEQMELLRDWWVITRPPWQIILRNIRVEEQGGYLAWTIWWLSNDNILFTPPLSSKHWVSEPENY